MQRLHTAPFRKRSHLVSAEGPQVTLSQSAHLECMTGQHGGQQMRKQQVAEVVAIEGANNTSGAECSYSA
jgi:hypothetical protein